MPPEVAACESYIHIYIICIACHQRHGMEMYVKPWHPESVMAGMHVPTHVIFCVLVLGSASETGPLTDTSRRRSVTS